MVNSISKVSDRNHSFSLIVFSNKKEKKKKSFRMFQADTVHLAVFVKISDNWLMVNVIFKTDVLDAFNSERSK